MPSEATPDGGWQRLHPFTLLFALGTRLYAARALAVPAVIALAISRGRRGDGDWREWELWLLAPTAAVLAYEVLQYVTLAYRLAPHDVVIRRGLFWKSERHIPYLRVQNVELVQHAAHRLAGVATVRLDTGTGSGAEAELAVLSLDAIAELREAVRAGRREAREPAAAGAVPEGEPAEVLAALSLPELLLHGLLTSRGTVVIAAIAGFLWQADVDGWDVGRYLPSPRSVWGRVSSDWATPWRVVEIGLLVLAVVLVFRVLSAIWSAVKHFGFTLTARGSELFQAYGLLTRVGRTIPRERIQKLTVTDDFWLRRFRRAAISVDTAAFVPEPHEEAAREASHVLVPFLPADRVTDVVRRVQPAGADDVGDFAALAWQPVDPRTFRRLLRQRLPIVVLASIGPSIGVGRWAIPIAIVAAAAMTLDAWIAARRTAFAWAGDTLVFRSGAWKRRVSLVRAARMQVVSLTRSPFDRRWGMAGVRVDTAGAAGGGHHVRIPWLREDVAAALYARLRRVSATT